MSLEQINPTDVAIGAAAVLVLAAYVTFLVVPAWTSYGRLWEKVAASFLTIFMLAALLGIGAAVGFAIVWSYDRWA